MALANPSVSRPSAPADVPEPATRPDGDRLQITPRETRQDNRVVLNVDVTRIAADGAATPVFTYAFEFEGAVLPPPQTSANMSLIASISLAMEIGLPVHVAGAVSRELLANLEEYQDAWTSWRPELYHRVPMSADVVLDDVHPHGERAVMLYSGGVDANFTLVNQLFGDSPKRRHEIVAALLVQGYDVPLDETEVFAERRRRAEGILAEYGIPLIVVRSNWREPNKDTRSYTYGHAAALAACLHAYEGLVDTGVIANDQAYSYKNTGEHLNGSNPITNPLLSSSRFRFFTDATRFARTAKAAKLSQWPAIRDQLHVCHTQHATNCCACEKCIRTMLCFAAEGLPAGAAFPREVSAWRVLSIYYWLTYYKFPFYYDIIEVSRRNGTLKGLRPVLQAAILLARVKLAAGQLVRRLKLRT